MFKKGYLQTMNITFQRICKGEREWTALGDFMNFWYGLPTNEHRPQLVADPLPAYDKQNYHLHRWAVFCAASVEWFCNKYDVLCPDWVDSPHYQLLEPWFFYTHESAKSRLLQTTPEEFKKRNIYCGPYCFDNKWELVTGKRQDMLII